MQANMSVDEGERPVAAQGGVGGASGRPRKTLRGALTIRMAAMQLPNLTTRSSWAPSRPNTGALPPAIKTAGVWLLAMPSTAFPDALVQRVMDSVLMLTSSRTIKGYQCLFSGDHVISA